MSHYDVAVVGYGPTGVTAANLLGALGLKVLVVERDAEVYARARAISTDEEVVRVWQGVGLADELTRDMLADRPISFVDHNGRCFYEAAFTPRGHGHPPQLFLYQPALEATLRQGVKRFPDVDVRLDQECLGIKQDPTGVDIELAEGIERASYLIAADGGSSPIRTRLGISFDGRTYEDRWVVVDTRVKREWPGHDHLRFHCDPSRPAVDCPTPLGHHRWEFPVLPGETEQHLVADVWRLLNRHGITDEHVEVLRAVVYSHHVRVAARWRVGRVFLAGDAAHAMPPWIGQGMSAGVRDVANLCWKLAGVLSGELSDTVLDSYETERKPHVRATMRRAALVGRVITERRPAITAARDAVFRRFGRSPWLRRQLMRQSWVPEPRYAQGFFTRSPGAGHKIPQPWVLDGVGARRRLDDLTSGWTVFSLAEQPDAVTVLPPGSPPRPGCVVDITGALIAWLSQHKVEQITVRPDGFVHSSRKRTA
ncbi:bifunctional 3-(3-hydroxy-phenyl)propionate/3-hydroxycinnamic acid hydroxylase [Kutzneria kofuensis]|uniref:3-(3-hydroxy-phenyl)propionate hydroxylase n=1 Tax=Kutzneria kofuensis TaxID=103725 RepID=A0A7W9NLS5_9PSEU|nr:bifunctional 3-(3-hydroxy-phenyl)propionate/3-hydroxycinnamic acid hydroxylase [Kutzneria kofuensis]MBB5897365.1 3-(3-hydroxy-phenyl)propionate hydroxylase [Kutzneria kofuensis]